MMMLISKVIITTPRVISLIKKNWRCTVCSCVSFQIGNIYFFDVKSSYVFYYTSNIVEKGDPSWLEVVYFQSFQLKNYFYNFIISLLTKNWIFYKILWCLFFSFKGIHFLQKYFCHTIHFSDAIVFCREMIIIIMPYRD